MSEHAARRETMQTLWQEAGLQAVETRLVRITGNFVSFDDYCESNLVMVGPFGQLLANMTPAEMVQLKAHLRATHAEMSASGPITS